MIGLAAMVLLWAIIAAMLAYSLTPSGFARKYAPSEYMGVRKASPDSFPWWFELILWLEWIVVIGIPAYLFFATVFSWPLPRLAVLASLIDRLLSDSDTMTVWSTQLTMAGLLAVGAIGWSATAFLFKLALSPFPSLSGFLALRNRMVDVRLSVGKAASKAQVAAARHTASAAWTEALDTWDLGKYADAQWRPMLIWTLVPWLVAGAVVILLLNNYVRVSPRGIQTTFFPSLTGQHWTWADIEEARIYLSPYVRGREKRHEVEAIFLLKLRNGSTQNLWDVWNGFPPPAPKLVQTADALIGNGVPVKLQLRDDAYQVALLTKASEGGVQSLSAESIADVFSSVEASLARKCGDDAKSHAIVMANVGKLWGC
jgi:hypothetical protein